ESLTISIWRQDGRDTALFQTTKDDGTVVIDRGRMRGRGRREAGFELADKGDGAGGAAVGAAELEGEAGEGEPGVHHLVQAGEVLLVRDVLAAAHHVHRIGGAGRVVRGRAVHAERLHLAADDPLGGRLAQAGEVGEVPLVAGEAVPGGGVEQQDVAWLQAHRRRGLDPVQVGGGDVGARLEPGDVQAPRRAVEQVQRHLLDGFRRRVRVEVGERVDVRGPVVVQHETG